MIKIYCIEDINDLKYIGSTKQTLNERFYQHKKETKYCSSRKLNLYNSIIYELEECSEEDRDEREQYYIDNIDCVNKNNTIHNRKECTKKWYQKNRDSEIKKSIEYNEKNKDKIKEYLKEYRKKNKDKINQYQKEYRKKNKSKNKI
jgi:hypothetical protein